jgi:hypothetical protein
MLPRIKVLVAQRPHTSYITLAFAQDMSEEISSGRNDDWIYVDGVARRIGSEQVLFTTGGS